MTPGDIRRAVSRAAEGATSASQVAARQPFCLRSDLPEGWDWARIEALCLAAVAPEGPEPAVVTYASPEDLFDDGVTVADGPEPLGRGSMVITTHVSVRRPERGGPVLRHRKRRHGLVLSYQGAVTVLWSPWQCEEAPA